MKPRGQLMIEHRLIERMFKVVDKELGNIGGECAVDPVFIDTVVDFIRTYADRTHHGKEEDILFRDLAVKAMSPEHSAMMAELVNEHKEARKTVGELVNAKERYLKKDEKAVDDIRNLLKWLLEFYPVHIEKEDKVFFPGTEKYFSSDELDEMLAEFNEFDRKMIHEKYARAADLLSWQKECY